jgi:hypothetical protein
VLSRVLIRKQRGRRGLTLIAVAGLLASAIGISGSVLAVHDEDFELDANTAVNAGGPAFDWESFFNSSGAESPTLPDATRPGFTASGFDRDFNTNANGTFNTSDSSTFATGSKDTLPITPGWQCGFSSNVNSKTDISNAYAVSYTDPGTSDEILYFGLERNANTGTGNIGFWFLQDAVSCETTTGNEPFVGDHVDGDILVVSEFSNGGAVATIQAYRWDGGANGTLNPNPVASGASCANAAGGDSICAIVNTVTITTSWLTANKQDGAAHSLRVSEFFEAGLNLTDRGLGGKCFSTFMGVTRSSTSLTATIFDFSLGTLGECTSETETTPSISQETIPADGTIDVTDDATVTVNGSDEWSGTLEFFICGPIATGTCEPGTGDSLGAGTAIDQDTTQPVTSPTATITEAGRYCFRAEFDGDEDVPDSEDSRETECFVIDPRPTTLDTLAGASPVDLGDPVTDTADLSGTANQPGSGGIGANGSINPSTAGDPANGTITFTLYKDDCTTVATGTGTNPQDVTVSGDATYGPVSFTPDAPGDYHWVASYSGDSPNTLGTDHNTACDDADEDVTVRQVPTSISSTQKALLQDSASIASTDAGVPLPAGGTVLFELFGPTAGATALQNCQADNGTGELYEEEFTTTGGDETFTTSNDVYVSVDATYYWKVTYDPNDNGFTGRQSSCSESTAVDFTNDAGPGTLFP